MNEHFEWAEVIEPTEYGAKRRADWLAERQARADDFMAMLNGTGQQDHQAAHDHLTRSKHGIFGASTGQSLAQANAEQQATIGTEWGDGRVLERNGHLSWSIAPAPRRVWASQINDRPGIQQGESPLLRYMRGGQ
jgi:hypothetical protein